MKKLAVVFAMVSLGAFGCGVADDTGDDRAQDVIDDAGKADAVSRPTGSFRSQEASAGQFTLVVLNEDRTFHREMMVYCFAAPCNPVAQSGTYTFSKSGDTRYIRFLDADGNLVDRYAYTWAADTLKLRSSGGTAWQALRTGGDGWCAVPDDCEGQGLVHIECVGQWVCESNSCAYSCETTNACEAAGGSCVALYPGTCADGTVGDANEYSCGGALGVQCCLPAAPQNGCTAKGGTCVAVYPGTCDNGIMSNTPEVACGPAGTVGTTCCLPYSACVPECRNVGTNDEGWVNPCTGAPICKATCGGETARCGAIGSRSEGWYASMGCIGGGGLIGWANCGTE
jgi:hypothetical protein